MSLVHVAVVKYIFLNLMQCKASQLVNVCMNVLCHCGPKQEQLLFPVNRVLRVVVYMVV